MQFQDVVGHTELKKQLRKNVLTDRIAHAQLFAGRRGSGDLQLALAYAKYVLCNDRRAKEACGVCTSCLSMDKLEHPDVHLSFPTKLEKKKYESKHYVAEWRQFVLVTPYGNLNSWSDTHAPDKNLEIRVGEAADIGKRMALRSYSGGYRVVIIWLPELMNMEATNKLLKAIEEPPEKTVFLLISNAAERLLPTIVSRTQRHQVGPVSQAEISKHLVTAKGMSEEDASPLAVAADGDMLRLSHLLEGPDTDMLPLFRSWMLSCYYNNTNDTQKACDEFRSLGREGQKRFIQYGMEKIRQCVLYAQSASSLVLALPEESDFLQKFKRFVSLPTAAWFQEVFDKMYSDLDRNANAKVVFMDVSYQVFSQLRKP